MFVSREHRMIPSAKLFEVSYARRRLAIYVAMLVFDTLAILLAYSLVGTLLAGTERLEQAKLIMGLIVPLYWLSSFNVGAYTIATLTERMTSARRALGGFWLAAAVVVFIAYFTKSSETFPRLTFGVGGLLASGLLVLTRLTLKQAAVKSCGPTAILTKVLVDGVDDPRIPHAVSLDTQALGIFPQIDDPYSLDHLARHLRGTDRVVVACPPNRRAAWANVLKCTNVEGEIIDEQVGEFGVLGSRRYGAVGTLIVSRGALGLRQRAMKRALDLVLAGVALVVLAPVFVLVAIAIVVEDRGPVLFVQDRVGRGNHLFRIYKFRSMRVSSSDRHGDRSTDRGDDRITRVGRIIRASSIDETPQLLNILMGTMTFVGPRPHALGSTAGGRLFWQIDPRYWYRHASKPGLTGLAQVRGWRGATHHEADLIGRLQADLDYNASWTLTRDLAILVRTLGVVLHKNAF